ncbi:MAG: GNAT family N-acetyltransferase [Gaiellales bacterium]
MSLEFRRVEPDELPAFVHAQAVAGGGHRTQEDVDRLLPGFQGTTPRAAYDGGKIVSTLLDFQAPMVVPGGGEVTVSAITWVSTLPTHRRRGAMRGLMDLALVDAREAGLDRAALWVSEYGIYGRFGFAPAAPVLHRIEVDTVHSAFVEGPPDGGRVRLLAAAEALELLPAILARSRRDCVGDVGRPAIDWLYLLSESRLSSRFVVIHEDAGGTADAYAIYRQDDIWEQGVPAGVIECEELCWTTAEGHAAVWRFLLDIDLVATVRVESRPLDDPIRWRLADPRRARFGWMTDGLWINLLDAPRALASRRYAADGDLVLDVEGTVLRLEAEDGRGTCAAGSGDPDIALGVRALASCHLGGHRFGELAQAGLVRELAPGALLRADAMFQPERAPWCQGEF